MKLETAAGAIRGLATRLTQMVLSAPDLTMRVPATPDWTVHQAFAHLVTVVRRYSAGPEGGGAWVAPSELPQLNAGELATLERLDVESLGRRLLVEVDDLLAQIAGYGDAPPKFRFHGGEWVAADVALGILVGEFVVHGWDIAQALGHRWPIDPAHVELILEGIGPILPGWVDSARVLGLSATFDIRLRRGNRHIWSFTDGRLEVDPPRPATPDVHVSADPEALVLVLYGRRSQWPFILTGKLSAWGRRPWLALTLASRFHKP